MRSATTPNSTCTHSSTSRSFDNTKRRRWRSARSEAWNQHYLVMHDVDNISFKRTTNGHERESANMLHFSPLLGICTLAVFCINKKDTRTGSLSRKIYRYVSWSWFPESYAYQPTTDWNSLKNKLTTSKVMKVYTAQMLHVGGYIERFSQLRHSSPTAYCLQGDCVTEAKSWGTTNERTCSKIVNPEHTTSQFGSPDDDCSSYGISALSRHEELA